MTNVASVAASLSSGTLTALAASFRPSALGMQLEDFKHEQLFRRLFRGVQRLLAHGGPLVFGHLELASQANVTPEGAHLVFAFGHVLRQIQKDRGGIHAVPLAQNPAGIVLKIGIITLGGLGEGAQRLASPHFAEDFQEQRFGGSRRVIQGHRQLFRARFAVGHADARGFERAWAAGTSSDDLGLTTCVTSTDNPFSETVSPKALRAAPRTVLSECSKAFRSSDSAWMASMRRSPTSSMSSGYELPFASGSIATISASIFSPLRLGQGFSRGLRKLRVLIQRRFQKRGQTRGIADPSR